MLNTLKRLFKHLKKPKLDSKVYLIFAAASLLLFLILSQTINFTHPPFSFLYPKPKSQASEEYPVSPYISSNYLQPLYGSPDFSYYLQPWRGYLKTVPATDLLSGIGINYNYGLAYQPNPPVNNDAIIKQLAESGFRRVRLEVFWGALNWDETNFWIGSRVQSILAACKKYGVRPLILLNANSVTPTPYKSFSKTLTQPAAIGDFVLHLNSTDGLIVNKSGITTTPGDVVMSHILFKEIDANTNTVTLSQPLSANFSSGQTINGYTMKYSPLFPVGTPEFDETMA